MEKISERMKELVKESNELDERMKKEIIQFVKESGGLVKTENESCDTIWGVFFNQSTLSYEEHQVLAVRSDGETLEIFAKVYPDDENDSDDEENWFLLDMVWRNATLFNICSSISQYV